MLFTRNFELNLFLSDTCLKTAITSVKTLNETLYKMKREIKLANSSQLQEPTKQEINKACRTLGYINPIDVTNEFLLSDDFSFVLILFKNFDESDCIKKSLLKLNNSSAILQSIKERINNLLNESKISDVIAHHDYYYQLQDISFDLEYEYIESKVIEIKVKSIISYLLKGDHKNSILNLKKITIPNETLELYPKILESLDQSLHYIINTVSCTYINYEFNKIRNNILGEFYKTDFKKFLISLKNSIDIREYYPNDFFKKFNEADDDAFFVTEILRKVDRNQLLKSAKDAYTLFQKYNGIAQNAFNILSITNPQFTMLTGAISAGIGIGSAVKNSFFDKPKLKNPIKKDIYKPKIKTKTLPNGTPRPITKSSKPLSKFVNGVDTSQYPPESLTTKGLPNLSLTNGSMQLWRLTYDDNNLDPRFPTEGGF
jgi:hypothetical protein